MPVTSLPRLDEPDPDRAGAGGPDHPMRKVTLAAAFEPESWTPERAAKVADLFDGLAPEWHLRGGIERRAALLDALARGGPFPPGPCLELGSGVGLVTEVIDAAVGPVIAIDLAHEMLTLSPAEVAPRVQADASRLPVPDGSIATLVCQNMLLFPREFDRVLRTDGVMIWVNTVGDRTPIHLSADEVERALPGAWSVVASEAGPGTWAVARRA